MWCDVEAVGVGLRLGWGWVEIGLEVRGRILLNNVWEGEEGFCVRAVYECEWVVI